MKFKRNEKCWCNSGKKYKYCHLNRESEEAFPAKRIFAQIHLNTKHKECLHPLASKDECSNKIINAHSIQKNGPLKFISDKSNHVYSIDIENKNIIKTGWQKASTFTGFCSKHDKEMFSPIEDFVFDNSELHCFLTGYRAYTLEYFTLVSILKSLPVAKEILDRGTIESKQFVIQQAINLSNKGFIHGMNDLKQVIDFYQNAYKENNYEKFSSLIIHFMGNLSIAISGAFSPAYSITGKKIQDITPNTETIEKISISTLVTNSGFALVFSYPSKFTSCNEFIDSIYQTEKGNLPSKIVEFMFSYIENTYFSKEWFDQLDDNLKNNIIRMATTLHCNMPISFTNSEYTDWEITEIIPNYKLG